MARYDIKAVMLDNHVEGSLPKCLAKEMGLALFLDLPNLWTGLEVSYVFCFFKEIL